MANRNPPGEHLQALQAILASTREIEASLESLDVVAFEEALERRGAELQLLESLSARTHRLDTEAESQPERDSLLRILQGLAESIQVTEARNRDLSNAALQALRMELREVRDGQRALQGYRNPTPLDPRFADRQG